MSYYRDPTAGAAIGAVDKEMGRMRKRAKRIRALYDSGKLSPQAFEEACRPFTGIFQRVLVDVMSAPPEEAGDEASPASR